jgi:hypothetical protein
MNKKIIFLLTTVFVFSVFLAGCEDEVVAFDCKVTFYKSAEDAGSGDPALVYDTQIVVSGKTLGSKFPSPPEAPENATFYGWFEDETEYTAKSVINADTKLTARWFFEDELITVSFDPDGGVPVNPIRLLPGKSLGVRFPEGRRRGFPFEGWFLGTTQYNKDTVITTSITLKAKWGTEMQKFTIKFSNPLGTFNEYPDLEFYQDELMGDRMPVPERSNEGIDFTYYTGYLFKGWLGNVDNILYNWDTPVVKNDTLVAQWKNSIIPETFILDIAAAPVTGSGRTQATTSYSATEEYDWEDADGKAVKYTGVRTVNFVANNAVYNCPMALNSELNPPPYKEDGTPMYVFNAARLRTQILRAERVTINIIGHSVNEGALFRGIVGNATDGSNWNTTEATSMDLFPELSREVGLAGTAGSSTNTALVIQHGSTATSAAPNVVKIARITIKVE